MKIEELVNQLPDVSGDEELADDDLSYLATAPLDMVLTDARDLLTSIEEEFLAGRDRTSVQSTVDELRVVLARFEVLAREKQGV